MRFRFVHTRIDPELPEDEDNRRMTLCVVEDEDRTFVGQAICNPKDQYVKSIGRKVSLTDAIQGLDKPTRALIWKQYLEKFKVPNA
jgi:hypothetical protein